MLAAGKIHAEVYQKLGVAESTWMRWKSRFGGMKSHEAKRLREESAAQGQGERIL
jgi:hypothetical protein